jgi:hypothetical protein
MKLFFLSYSLSFFSFNTFSQDKSQFRFWVSSVDKASYSRTTYVIGNDSILIREGPYDFIYFAKEYEKDKIVFKIKLDSIQKNELIQLGEKIKTDSIKTLYDNLCIIDGMILHFHFEC